VVAALHHDVFTSRCGVFFVRETAAAAILLPSWKGRNEKAVGLQEGNSIWYKTIVGIATSAVVALGCHGQLRAQGIVTL